MIENESIICFAGEDWWYHHPHANNHIMLRLAKKNKVMFVNSVTMGMPSANKDFFMKVIRKLKSYLRFARRVENGLLVVSPITIPLFGLPFVAGLNKVLLSVQIRLLMLLNGFSEPIVWIGIPTAASVVGTLGEKLLVYRVSDKHDTKDHDTNANLDVIRSLDKQMIEQADIVLYSGKKLFDESVSPREKTYLLEQAVDYDHFSRTTAESFTLPEDFPVQKKKEGDVVLGYFGAGDYVLDQNLIRTICEKRPQWKWVFIGNKSKELHIAELQQVFFIGPRPYEELPRYASFFDVCVLPWVQDNEFVQYGSSIKVREYIATGKPVVITPLYEFKDIPDLVRVSKTAGEFIAHVEEGLQESDEEKRKRQAYIEKSTWDERTEFVSELFTQYLEKREAR